MVELCVVHAGMLATVQDRGRVGWQAQGVPVSGPADWVSAALANAVVGNPIDAPLVEFLVHGPTVEACGGTLRIAVVGRSFAMLQGNRDSRCLWRMKMAGWQLSVWEVPSGAQLTCGTVRQAARGYLAVAGGLVSEAFLGSQSTLLGAPWPGQSSRPLKGGDRLGVGQEACLRTFASHTEALATLVRLMPHTTAPTTIRLLAGPQQKAFSLRGNGPFVIDPNSDRTALRLTGAVPDYQGEELFSLPLVRGAVQVPGDGTLLVAGADHPVTGGYPIWGIVAFADEWRLGELLPGARLYFRWIGWKEAVRAAENLRWLVQLATGQTVA
ncbi:MAG: biotin-dependent carboxyltransferase family protein [Firmicutes bacterium]|nr:biotin-dependent carboxyltransferase family protein [Bacillota bacterium]